MKEALRGNVISPIGFTVMARLSVVARVSDGLMNSGDCEFSFLVTSTPFSHGRISIEAIILIERCC